MKSPDVLGVRLSPVTLNPTDAKQLASSASDELGGHAYVVVSAPGLAFRLAATQRLATAPDQRAAEQATAWRNAVDVKQGDHLVYISAEEHDKAGGLRDCLIELSDSDIAREILNYCSEQGGALRDIAVAMGDANLIDRMSPVMLADFVEGAENATGGKKDKDAWTVLGSQLPRLGLVQDSKLSKTNAADRLIENRKLITRAATGESRRQSSGPLANVERQLRDGLRSGESSVLGKVDLGPLKMPKSSKLKRKKSASTPPPKKAISSRRGAAEPAPEPTEQPVDDHPPGGRRSTGSSSGSSAHAGPRWGPTEALPEGTREIFHAAHDAGGIPLRYQVRTTSRAHFRELPSNATLLQDSAVVPPAIALTIAALCTSRAEFVAAIDGDPMAALRVLIRHPAMVLRVPEIATAADKYLANFSEALLVGTESTDETMRRVIERETVTFVDESGPGLVLVGPLHPLWLAQMLESARALVATTVKSEADVLKHAFDSPMAPATWPIGNGKELRLAEQEHGLLVFERDPEVASVKSLELLGYRVAQQYLELCPHARLGLRVAVVDGTPSPVVEGLAKAAIELGEDVQIRAFCDRPLDLAQLGEQLFASSRLSVGALSAHVWDCRPHIVIRLATRSYLPDEDEPGVVPVSAVGSGSVLKTDFVLDGSGLRARVDVTGVPALLAFDRVHATLRRRRPLGAFAHDLRMTTLSAALPTTGASAAVWHVAVGPALGRRAPMDYRTLVYEAIDSTAVCAVISRDVRPAARAVAEALSRAGLMEDTESLKAISALTSRLATGSGGGVLSLAHSGERLIAAGLLGLEMQRRGIVVIGHPAGSQYQALTGEPANRKCSSVAIGINIVNDRLTFTVGYATLDMNADLKLYRNALTGAVADRIKHVLQVVRLSSGDGPAAIAAREILSWLLWPAIAAQAEQAREIAERMSNLATAETPAVVALVMAPPSIAASNAKSLELDGTSTSLVALNTDLFNRLVLAG